MPLPDLTVTPVRSKAEWKEFATFPWKVYAGDPNWVPPLIADVIKMFDPSKHPFHEHAEVRAFLARRGATPREGKPGEVVGRIAAIVNRAHNEFHGEKTGFFGFFETLPDPTVPPALLQTAASWLRARGMERMRGPASFSSNEEWGLLVDGFDSSPMVMMTYNPPAYVRYLEEFGCVKAKDLVAYFMPAQDAMPEAYVRLAAQTRDGVRVRPLDMKRFQEEVGRVREVYNAAWERNWGFVPMTEKEIEHMAKELKPVVDPDYVCFAEVDGRTVGFSMVLPDANQALKAANGRLYPFGIVKLLLAARKIKNVRVLTLGVIPEYRRRHLDIHMYVYLWNVAQRKGTIGAEFSWVLEDNLRMRKALDRMGSRVYKTYRLYDYPLAS